MTMTDDEDQGGSNVGFLSWGVSNSDHNDAKAKKMISMQPMNQNGSGETVLVNKKQARKGKNVVDQGNDGNGNSTRDVGHVVHIWTERERRKKMRNMFSTLHSMLPHLPPKADKSTIVDEAVSYIKDLQQTLEKLEKQKQERLQSVSTTTTFGCDSSVIHSQWNPYDPSLGEALMIAADQGSSSNNNYLSNITAVGTSNNGFQPAVAFQTWTSPNMVLNICGDEAQFCICATKKPGILTTIAYVLEKYKIEVVSTNILSNNRNAYMILAHVKQASNQIQDAKSVEELYRQAAGEITLWIA